MLKNDSMTKKFRKPTILKKTLGRNYAVKCGRSHIAGCGKLIVIS